MTGFDPQHDARAERRENLVVALVVLWVVVSCTALVVVLALKT